MPDGTTTTRQRVTRKKKLNKKVKAKMSANSRLAATKITGQRKAFGVTSTRG